MKRMIVVGGGPAGYVGALHAAAHGAQVTLVNSAGLGGTCLQRGCIPTKTLVASCSLLERLRDAERFGIEVRGSVGASWGGIQRRVHQVVGTVVKGVDGLLASRRIRVIDGHARLLDSRTLEVSGHEPITGDALLLCTGSQPVRPALFPFDGERVVTSDEALRWETLPGSLVIIGEGIVACEFAFIYRALGVDVTIVGMMERVLPNQDGDVSKLIAREMRKRGIRFVPGVRVERLAEAESGMEVHGPAGSVACAERVLVCIGRVPATGGLGLERIGLAPGARGEIAVDPLMRTAVPGVYAAGDVTGRMMLAHAASAQAKLAVEHMLGIAVQPLNEGAIPCGIFTMPEVGAVGMTEEAARRAGLDVACGSFDLRTLGKAQAIGELAGLFKVVTESGTGRLLGAHIVGPHATDMIHEAAIVLRRGGSVRDVLETVHTHPTLSEGLAEAAEDAVGQATHKLLKKTA